MKSFINLRPKTIKQIKETLTLPQDYTPQIKLIPYYPPNTQTPIKPSQIHNNTAKNTAIYLTLTERKSLKSNQYSSLQINSLRKIKSIKQLQPLHKDKASLTSRYKVQKNIGLQSPIKSEKIKNNHTNRKIPIDILALKERALDNSRKKMYNKSQKFNVQKTINSTIHYHQP